MSCTGQGEIFIRWVAAYDVAARIHYGGQTLEDAVNTPGIRCLVGLVHDIEDGRRAMSLETFDRLVCVCQALAGNRATVWAVDITRAEAVQALVQEICQTSPQAYAASKAALVSLTRQLGHELGEWGITVNCIAPGFVRSNPNTERQWEAMGEAGQLALLKGIALKRLGTPQDIANGVLFFASEHAGWISGQTISIDGGK